MHVKSDEVTKTVGHKYEANSFRLHLVSFSTAAPVARQSARLEVAGAFHSRALAGVVGDS